MFQENRLSWITVLVNRIVFSRLFTSIGIVFSGLFTSIGIVTRGITDMHHTGFMVDARRFSKSSLEVDGKISIRIHQTLEDNRTWIGYIEETRRNHEDDLGALYYVVAVIFIYGLSIVMMIASHIRKNKQDNQLRTYLKEMAKLRKDDRREKVMSKINDLANRRHESSRAKSRGRTPNEVSVDSEADSEACQPLVVKDSNEDNTDSVFLQPDCKIVTDHKSSTTSGRVRSLSCHDNGYRKYNYGRCAIDNKVPPISVHNSKRGSFEAQGSKVVKIQDSKSSSMNNCSSVVSQFNLSPSSNYIQLSPLQSLDHCPAINHQAQQESHWKDHGSTSTNDARIHNLQQQNLPYPKCDNKRPSWPLSVSIVKEDAIL